MRDRNCVMVMLALSVACSSDKPSSTTKDVPRAEPAIEEGKAPALPPLTRLGKAATELEADGWTAAPIPAEMATRLRDTVHLPPLGSPALESEVRGFAQPANTPAFDTIFSDTVSLIEGALTRIATERRNERESEVVDSLQRLMAPRDPDLDAVPAETVRPGATRHVPIGRDLVIHLAISREGTRARGTVAQQSQTRTVQLASGIEGSETTSSDGSSTTTEISFQKGGLKSTTKMTTTSPEQYLKSGEVGVKHDITTTKKGQAEGATLDEIDRRGWEERLAYCPDAGGVVRGRYTRWIRISNVTTVGSVTINYAFDVESNFNLTVSVDDNARAQETLVEGTVDLQLAIGARGGGNARPSIKKTGAEAQWRNSVGEGEDGSFHLRFPSLMGEDKRLKESLESAVTENLGLAGAAVQSLAKEAEKRWRNGACVEVLTNPESKALRYGGRTRFRIDVKHKRDRSGSFPYPVRMMAKKDYAHLDRTLGKLDPQGTLTAPATFQYTAPAKGTREAATWRSSFPTIDRAYPMSISRRGIGAGNIYVPYDSLRRTFHVTYQHLRETDKHGVAQNVRYRAVLRELDQPDDDGNTFAGTGEYKLLARLWKANCASYAPEELEVINGGGAVRAKASVSSEDAESISLIIQLEPLSGPRMRMFTRSFAGLEQQLRKQVAHGDQNDVPFMANRAVALVNVRGKAGDTTGVVVTGKTECEGEMTTKTLARIRRLQ
jgi:hypothetical protein